MRTFEIDWLRFLNDLLSFQQLPVDARRVFMEKLIPSQSIMNGVLGEQGDVLLSSGFLIPGPRGQNVRVPMQYQSFCRVMRALQRQRVFDSPTHYLFDNYVTEHFTGYERSALCRVSYRDGYSGWTLYARISSPEWLRKFLEAKATDWEVPYADGRYYFPSLDVLRSTQELVRILMKRPEPLPLLDLPALWNKLDASLFPAYLQAGLRYLLFFTALRGDDLEPVVGIWPKITKKLFGGSPPAPGVVTPREVFHSPFLMEDMASILAASAAEPLRIRGDDYGLFARAEQEIGTTLGTLPEWVEREFQAKPQARITMGVAFARSYAFLKQKGRPGRDLRLELTEAGQRWMGLPAKERLKVLVDGLRCSFDRQSDLDDYTGRKVSLLPYPVESGSMGPGHAIRSSVLASYAERGLETFADLSEFLAYHRERDNPLISAQQENPRASFVIRGLYVSTPDPEDLEEGWSALLADFLRLRLVPLGAAKVGLHGQGAACFAITEVGRYMLGAQSDFEFAAVMAGRIVVQPNFEVVFLAPAGRAESEIARFAERKGRHLGTLFKITKKSIHSAAAAGLTTEQVFETLRQCCAGELPANVEREITGWFAQCRRIRMIPAVLIHCPDAETAVRVLTVAGKKASRLTETTLELLEPKAQPSLLKKLREMGIFVRSGTLIVDP
jgi:hypothetical protein